MYSHGADNSEGQFGKTTAQSNSYAPVRVDIPDDEVINHISAEKNSNLATTADNTVWAWGNYADGQMGANGTSSAPVQIVSNDGGVWSSSNGIKGALNGAAGGDSMSHIFQTVQFGHGVQIVQVSLAIRQMLIRTTLFRQLQNRQPR